MSRQTFFEHSVLECDLGDDFLQFPILASQIFDFVSDGLSDGVSGKLLLARFEKVLAPSVVEVRGDAFSTTEIGDALLASKPFKDNADLLFRRELPWVLRRTSRNADSLVCFFWFVISTRSLGSWTPECVS
jgi:hypothetical protein